MLQCKSLILALLWQLICVEGGFTSTHHRNDWNDWIILPARSRASDRSGDLKSFSGFRVNQSDIVSTYLDPVRMEPYIMTISEKKGKKKERFPGVKEEYDDNSGDDLIVPLGRAIEKVRHVYAIFKELFEEDYNLENEGRAPKVGTTRKIKKLKKKYKKFLLPLLLAYKLKFLTLIPVLIGGLLLLVGTTGLAGFFFALFTAVMSLKGDTKLEVKKW